jgi:hypothetical protein
MTKAWSKDQADKTLRGLQADYPGYTDNELYAIWCHENGKIPLDAEGKLILEQWQIHAESDGAHVDGGPFRVSRALFGRARKARKGHAKPKTKRQLAAGKPKSAAPAAAASLPPMTSNGLSPRALEFAQAYDQAAKLIDGIVLRRHEINDLAAELREVKESILEELAAASPETAELLREVGAIG